MISPLVDPYIVLVIIGALFSIGGVFACKAIIQNIDWDGAEIFLCIPFIAIIFLGIAQTVICYVKILEWYIP